MARYGDEVTYGTDHTYGEESVTGGVPPAPWTPTGGGNHLGEDWVIDEDTAIAGVHFNIGRFAVLQGIQADIFPYDGADFGDDLRGHHLRPLPLDRRWADLAAASRTVVHTLFAKPSGARLRGGNFAGRDILSVNYLHPNSHSLRSPWTTARTRTRRDRRTTFLGPTAFS